MFIPGIVQALIAALTFGIVLQAASSAVFLFAKGHGSKLFRDGLRLVLITFLASSALWAQIDFAALTIDPTAVSGCQVAVIFSTIFDQLARFSIEQYLLWAINANARAPAGAMIPQAVLGLRFVLGAVFVGFQRPQIATVCVARTDILPIGIIVMVSDFLIVLMLAIRANSLGLVAEAKSGRASAQGRKAVLWTIGGLAVWTAGSIPLLLGIESIELLFRTAIPATALSLLIGIVTGFSTSLLPPRPQQATHPDAQSPRNISSSRDLATADSDYPPSRYEDLKAGNITTVTTFAQPREAPRPEVRAGAGGALPIIAGSVPGQSNIGVGGVPVQGQLFPPMRAQTAPVRESTRTETKPKMQYKRSIFDRNGPSIKNAISNPILQETGDRNPLTKIATVDLETAVKNDRERRDNDMAVMQRSPSLIAQRPAPQPPAITPEEALKRAQSMKRKDLGPMSPPVDAQPVKSAGLMSNPPATTSSAQLSPGVEEIRRRSPRHTPPAAQPEEAETKPATPRQAAPVSSISPPRPPRPERPLSPFETMERSGSQRTVARSVSQKTLDRSASQKSTATVPVPPPPPKSAARLMSPKKPDLPSTWPIQSSVDPTIRPSRMKPLSPKKQDVSSAPQTGLQRRATTGLPSNPRAMAMRALPQDALTKEQTVMFVNNIQYNDPTAVQNIIQGAASQANKTPLGFPSPGSALKSSGSVVHRPRPIPRQQGKDRQIFPAENNHRRSKSGGSIISRKSILMSNPGSPTQLPPLPPPPKSAGNLARPQPNDTKSMTFDEKMDLFFPRPPSSSGAAVKTAEPIPALPLLPAAYKPESKATTVDQGGWDTESSRDQSNRSTKTSVRTRSILEIDEPPRRVEMPPNTSKFSVDTSVVTGRGAADDRESWIPDVPVDKRTRNAPSYDGVKRQSSPVLPARNLSLSEFSEARTRDEETTTNWGSIHSPVVAVNLSEVTHMPKPTWIQPRDVSMISHNDGKEVMTIMLDASIEHERDVEVPLIHERPIDVPDVKLANHGSQWHRRIGDETITFSERKEKVNSRRMPPPMPLQLKSPVRKIGVPFHVAEPSPLESPQHAYEMIQAQLKKLEEPSRDSYESQGQRIRLLESLEAEMGQQENQWQQMHNGLSRDSLSTVGTTSVRNSRHESQHAEAAAVASSHSRDSSLHSIAADRRASRRARMQSGSSSSLSKASYEDLRSASSTSSDNNNRTSLWQQRLADAQLEYIENAPELLAKRNLNFLSVSKARASAQLGSPTPPDTDEDSDGVDAQILAALMPKERAAPEAHLWVPASPVHSGRELTLLWAPAHDVATRWSPSDAGVQLPGLSVRPVARKLAEPLAIESTQLWKPDHTAAKKLRRSSLGLGLWRPSYLPEPELPKNQSQNQPQPQPQPRPVTQRPPRRSKRVTLLPDILESPVPLPDKRGTLGIFQFPWGEKSDTATVQPRPSHTFMAMPGTMSTGGPAVRAALEARAKQLESEEYSSSFFDDYDEEEEGDDDVSDIDDDSDDGFDETTLWEIASLLQSDQVPSKNSLLPQPAYYRPDSLVEEDYPSQGSSEYTSEDEKDEDEAKHDSMVITGDSKQTPAPSKPSSLLWTGRPSSFISARKSSGLPQPDARAWMGYMDAMQAPARVQARLPEPAVIQSKSLWVPKPAAPKSTSGPLWGTSQKSRPTKPTKALWVARPAIVESVADGLFNPSHKRVCFRTTSASPVGLSMSSTARVTVGDLPVLTSTSLWTPKRKVTKSLWIAPPAIVEAEPTGLFNPSHKRVTFRNTHAAPVGLSMPSVARVTVEALPVLTSNNLWRPKSTNPLKSLWAAPPVVFETVSKGLFDPSHKRVVFRTTSAPPVGLGMPSTARVTEESLPTLTSTSLWIAPAVAPQVHDWITLGTVRPCSPSYAASSGRSTPTLDTASTGSFATEAVSDFDPLPDVVVKQPTWWDNLAPKTDKSAPQHLHRTKSTAAEWDAALHEAMRPVPVRLVRAAASPAQWEDALNEALSASMETVPFMLDDKVYTPHEEKTSTSLPLWTAPVVATPKDTGIMWVPPAKPRLHIPDAAPLVPEDAESRNLRLKRSKTGLTAGLVSFDGHPMWNRFYGAELRRVVPLGGGHDWLEGTAQTRASKVIFRY